MGTHDDGNNSSDEEEEEDAKSTGHPESIDIKVPTQEEEKTERQLEKLAEQFPTLSRPRSHPVSSRLPPITTVMATQITTEPTQTHATEEGMSSAQKGGGPPDDEPNPQWFGDQCSHTKCQGEVVAEVVEEEEEDSQEQQETQTIGTMAQS